MHRSKLYRLTPILLGACALAAAAACSATGGDSVIVRHGTGDDPTATDGTGSGDGTDTGTGSGSGSGTDTASGTGTGTATGAGTGATADGGTVNGADPLDTATDPLAGLPRGQAQLTALCARKLGDAVSKAFCGATPPVITSLVDLQKLLGLDFKPGNIGNGTGGNPAFALVGHSSSLVTRFTSAINPRAIIFTPPASRGRVRNAQPLASFVAMGFVRGEEFVELVSNDPTARSGAGDLNFFLFKFEHACSSTAAGCTNAELLTPAVESGFTGAYTLYQETDIKNTILDCQQCHQTGGPTGQKILRMQELQNPWGHFFRNNRQNGQVLQADYQAAHGTTETYAGIPGAVIFNPNTTNNNGTQTAGGGSDPAALEGLLENQGFTNQPNEYNTNNILRQVQAVNANQPASNLPMGTSTVWDGLFNNSKNGLDIPPPYHDIKVTDPTKLAAATASYKGVMAGTTPAAQLFDVREVLLDSAFPDMSFAPAPGLDGKGILVQMCQQCHNAKLDQTETREKFRVDQLDQMTRAEKDVAIKRLNLPATAFRRMPPPRFRNLTAEQIQLVTAELRK